MGVHHHGLSRWNITEPTATSTKMSAAVTAAASVPHSLLHRGAAGHKHRQRSEQSRRPRAWSNPQLRSGTWRQAGNEDAGARIRVWTHRLQAPRALMNKMPLTIPRLAGAAHDWVG